MTEAVIVEAVRTPIGKRDGALAALHPTDLGAVALNAAVSRSNVSAADVDDVQWGCVTQLGDQSSNVGRFVTLAAGWPESVPAVTINRACGSSQQGLDHAAWAVLAGHHSIVIAGGGESMSRVPLGAARREGRPYGPTALGRFPGSDFGQIAGAQTIAERWGLSRTEIDEYAVRSHELAAAAIDRGAFDAQIVAVDVGGARLSEDEGVRRGTSVERLAALPSLSGPNGVIHAGNASQISDAAAALLVMSAEECARRGLKPIAAYRRGVASGADPRLVLTGVIPATEKVLRASGISLSEIGVFEVNEAFAVVPLAWMKEFGVQAERVNPLGGAIALGHPLGASGAILMTRMVHHMREKSIRYGLQVMCETGGTANATIVELIE